MITEPGITLISSIILDPQVYELALENGFNSDWLETPEDKAAWNILKDIYNTNKTMNLVTFTAMYNNAFYNKRITERFADLLHPQSDGMSAVEVLKNSYYKNKVRSILTAALPKIEHEYEPYNTINEIATELQELITCTQPHKKENLLDVIMKDIEPKNIISTGYPYLDWMVKGVEENAFWVIGASTSHGKSMFVLNIAYNVAKQGHPVTLFTTELGDRVIYKRLATMISGVNPSLYMNITDHQRDIFKEGLVHSFALPITIVKTCSLAVMRMHIQKRQSKLYIVDYLQMVLPEEKISNEVRKLGYVTRELETLSKNYDTCIISTSQYSRPRTDENISPLHKYRGSGEIEENTDIGIALKFPCQEANWEEKERLKKEGKDNIIIVGVKKNRLHGISENFNVIFNRDSLIIEESHQRR